MKTNMARSTRIYLDEHALLHNVKQVKQCAPFSKIIAMVKANAYGCGLPFVVPILDAHVDAFGVACLDEARALRALGCLNECVLFQGVSQLELATLKYGKQRTQSKTCFNHQHPE